MKLQKVWHVQKVIVVHVAIGALGGVSVKGLSLIFQVDRELKKVAGGQKESGATAVGCY